MKRLVFGMWLIFILHLRNGPITCGERNHMPKDSRVSTIVTPAGDFISKRCVMMYIM